MWDFRIIHIDETDSTNCWLRNSQQLTANSQQPIAVVAAYQTAGKGCGTNSWESERGKNLTFSMMIHPDEIPANRQFHITEVVSVALCKTLEHYIYNKVEIKWPNDIYVGDKKISGMLIENRLQGSVIKDSVIGIGLNVNQTKFRSDAPNPVSIKQLTGKETDLDELLMAFLDCFNAEWNSKTTCFDYRKMLFRREGRYLFKDKTTCFTASIIGVKEDGRLVLQDEKGLEHTYAFKEVQFII